MIRVTKRINLHHAFPLERVLNSIGSVDPQSIGMGGVNRMF